MKSIVFFDGVCNLCNAWVDFLAPRLKKNSELYFASLQGKTAEQILAPQLLKNQQLDSVLFWHEQKLLRESDAVLAILGFMRLPWSLFQFLRIIPRPFRNAIYRWIARNRYRWFGQRTECRMPTESERTWFQNRFLD